MTEPASLERVMVTGATGFVGRAVIRELLARGLKPICLVRSSKKLLTQHRDIDPQRLGMVVGGVSDLAQVQRAAEQSQAAIHLVGIILERPFRKQTFTRIHCEGTKNVVEAVARAGIKRLVHMSALGTRADAACAYHRTKWEAEERVRQSRLDWTIVRPSVIHGPDGAFMRLLRRLICGLVPPVIPCFGTGQAKLQPVSVKDVAFCLVESLFRAEAIHKGVPLGGPDVYSWREMYQACRLAFPRARPWKPVVSIPAGLAKVMATASAPAIALAELVGPSAGLFRFNRDQVQMAQEDSVCDHTVAERLFGVRMRAFDTELADYADRIE